MSYKEINVRDLPESPVKMIADNWALLSAGNATDWNTMTVSWGAIGEIWGKDAVFAFVRPQRYTKEFIDREERFSLSFLPAEKKEALRICGRLSGRDSDKLCVAGLHGVFCEGTVWPDAAATVFVCRKLAAQPFDPAAFIDPAIEGNYPNGDYHTMYVGEIEQVLVKE
ncbi:MAG: flavin reductase [Oscillospiraceae bacterium]|jgi:flavin reductase (DIM6/NTAB) family NADH-FMN oxidoreductase RutF|nr:flavin reductase [Oscillospiraceae bacterium]